MFFKKQNNKLKVVFEDDLKGYLSSLGLLKKIEDNSIRCSKCGNVITLENLEVIVPVEKTIKIICSNPKCLTQH